MKFNLPVESVDKCIICSNSRCRPDLKFARRLGLIPPYGIQRCDRCGLRWLSPRPTAAAYQDLYSRNSYFDGPRAVESYEMLAWRRSRVFKMRVKNIEKHFSSRPLRIMDVGAATGEFVIEAIRRGHDAMGMELSSDARKIAETKYGLVLQGPLVWEETIEESYDVIHMNHVFEHLPNPEYILERSFMALRPGGLLVMEVPQQFENDLDRLKRILRLSVKPDFNPYSLHHTYFYSWTTLKGLLEKHLFHILRFRTANPGLTPLRVFSVKNALLRVFLWLSDKIHHGGNILEVYARKI